MDNNENKKNNDLESSNNRAPHVNRAVAIAFISIFMAILILPTAAWGILKIASISNPVIMEKLNFDTGENRQMASFPQKFNIKTIASDIEKWYNDNLPFRSVIYSTYDKIDEAMEKPYDNTILPGLISIFHPNNQSNGGNGNNVLDFITTEDDQENNTEQTESETIPEQESGDEGDPNCTHVLDVGSVDRVATCDEYGVKRYSCTLCSYYYLEYLPKTEHYYVLTSGTIKNCLADSEATYTCQNCEHSYTKTAKRGHSGNFIKTVKASYDDYGYDLYRCKTCGTRYRANITAKLLDNSFFPLQYKVDTVVGREGWIFYAGNNSLDYYQGTNMLEESELAEITSMLQKLQDLCDERGIKLAFLILPNKEQVYYEHMPSLEIANSQKRTEALVDYVSANSNVNILYPINEIMEQKPYWRVYYKYDTHWNTVGAFIGTQVLYNSLGIETTDIQYCAIEENKRVDSNKKVVGDLILAGGYSTSGWTPDIEYSIKYKPEVEVTDLAGQIHQDYIYQTSSTSANQGNLVFVGDSFRINMIDYLVKDFSKCTIINRSIHMKNSTFRASLKDVDYLVIEAVERFDYEIYLKAKEIYNILLQTPVE